MATSTINAQFLETTKTVSSQAIAGNSSAAVSIGYITGYHPVSATFNCTSHTDTYGAFFVTTPFKIPSSGSNWWVRIITYSSAGTTVTGTLTILWAKG